MVIVGCDFHPSWQQVAIFDPETGEIAGRKLMHSDGEAERFYRGLPAPSFQPRLNGRNHDALPCRWVQKRTS